ncbi:response regulator [Spirosoma pomorum]
MKLDNAIVVIDDDDDDKVLWEKLLRELAPDHPAIFFDRAEDALEQLNKLEDEQPFIIFCEVFMPGMSGVEFRRAVDSDEKLRRRSIPFVFFAETVNDRLIEEAYSTTIQGLFERDARIEQLREQLEAVLNYWRRCIHPNHQIVRKNQLNG